MGSIWIPTTLRLLVEERAAGCCEYCRVAAADVFYPHEPDHIIGIQHGGLTGPENLAFACFHYNRQKGPNIASLDPDTGELSALFHPRRCVWTEHFRRDDAQIFGISASGRATVSLLQFNAAPRLEVRRSLLKLGRYL